MAQPITAAAFDVLPGLADWRVVLRQIEADFVGNSFTGAAEVIARIAEAADSAEHHPDVQLRYPGAIHVVLTTHASGGVTDADVDLAREISALAAAAGMRNQPDTAAQIEIAIDAIDIPAIRPFWKAVMGYVDQTGAGAGDAGAGGDDGLVDPLRRGPGVWFQQMDEARPPRSRIHIDVIVSHDQADARVAAAVAAGGRLVDESFARAWWVLADAEGNEACVCTWQDRDAP